MKEKIKANIRNTMNTRDMHLKGHSHENDKE